MRIMADFSHLALVSGLWLALSSGAVAEGVVDLAAAGCPAFPEPAKQVGVMLVLHPDGTASDCRIGTGYRATCGHAWDDREGFLCIGFNGENPPVHVSAEGPYSQPVDRFIVDGTVAAPEPGFANSHYTAPYGSGPSGDTYDVVAEKTVGETAFVATLNVTVTAPNTIRFNSLEIRYAP